MRKNKDWNLASLKFKLEIKECLIECGRGGDIECLNYNMEHGCGSSKLLCTYVQYNHGQEA